MNLIRQMLWYDLALLGVSKNVQFLGVNDCLGIFAS